MEKQITEEMEGVQSNSELYVRQTLMINNASIDEEGFEQCAYEIEHQLKRAGYTDIALYNTEGDLLSGSVLPVRIGGKIFSLPKDREARSPFVMENRINATCIFLCRFRLWDSRWGFLVVIRIILHYIRGNGRSSEGC